MSKPANHQLIHSRESAEWTAIEARRLTDEVKADAQRLWAKLLHLYEGGAHIALGYSSWSAYCEHEFRLGKAAYAYRLLQAAHVVDQLARKSPIGDSLKVTSQVPESEAIARELAQLRHFKIGNRHISSSYDIFSHYDIVTKKFLSC
jgi:hypothetical protein